MISLASRWLTFPYRFLFGRTPYCPSDRRPRPTPRLEALESRDLLSTSSDVWNFVTAPQLHPMKVSVQTQQAGTAPGLVFVGPYALSENPGVLVGQAGPLIMDNAGNPVWFLPVSSNNKQQVTDFRVQTLFGQQVLTWWQGTIAGTVPSNLPDGSPLPGAYYVIENNHYQQIMTVTAQNGFTSDLHEFLITPAGTAVFISIKAVSADLTPYGGLKNGSYVDPEIQEIDLRTGKLIFTWDMHQHVPLSDSLVPPPTTAGQAWDVFHMNSLEVSPDGSQILVSARNTWTIYDIRHDQTGNILWELGGKENQFTFPTAQVNDSTLNTGPSVALPGHPPGSFFQYQHHARYVFDRNGMIAGISLFDDAGQASGPVSGPFGPGRGMVIDINLSNFTAMVQNPLYYHNPDLFPNSQGDVELLSNSDEFIGWGADVQSSGTSNSYYSEYTSNARVLYDAVMPGQNVSYRAYRNIWVGLPLTRPAVAVRQVGGQRTVYASWNGSTETTSWQLLAGPSPNALKPVTTTPCTGFETAITTTNAGPFYQVQALGADGSVLSTSAVVSFPPAQTHLVRV